MGKHQKNKVSSSTPRILKGDNCKKSDLKVWFAKDSKMYKKDPKAYLQVSEIINKLNFGK